MEGTDKKLEAKISLVKGWYRLRSKEEMRTEFRRLTALIERRRPQRIKEMEHEIFGAYL